MPPNDSLIFLAQAAALLHQAVSMPVAGVSPWILALPKQNNSSTWILFQFLRDRKIPGLPFCRFNVRELVDGSGLCINASHILLKEISLGRFWISSALVFDGQMHSGGTRNLQIAYTNNSRKTSTRVEETFSFISPCFD
mmetsp:Transcript_8695/g.21430  ORF Transcript_8695/g.21430 Transcript_8695/m.21430 type:complete len:139 (-) Transcript_8695:1701-2117(-)